MVELFIMIVILALVLYVIAIGSIFFIAVVAYGYWGLSIGMAPVLWLFMIIGAIVGFFITLKNVIKATKAMKIKE